MPFSATFDVDHRKIVGISEQPILRPGPPGHFDSDGVMPTCLVSRRGVTYLFYIGWNRGADVPFRNAIGIAESHDSGLTFRKKFSGPLLDRSVHDPCFVASCDILEEGNDYKMWYLSALRWENDVNRWKPYYHIKYASSDDLIHWKRDGKIAIDFSDQNEYAISTPRVLKDIDGYSMWYSYRGSKNKTYRIGYATSKDAENWTRKDENVLLGPESSGWDSEMICYPFLFWHKERLYMLYNGNGYGKSGFGLAILKK